MLNLQRSVRTFCTKVCDYNQNYVHRGKNNPHQEVEDSYIFINNFVKKSGYLTNIFYVTLLSRRTVIIEPTGKPIILGY